MKATAFRGSKGKQIMLALCPSRLLPISLLCNFKFNASKNGKIARLLEINFLLFVEYMHFNCIRLAQYIPANIPLFF